MKQLLTIFNRNDPTPTASSIISADVDQAIVLVIGADTDDLVMSKSLERMVIWTSGSARNENFPSQLWDSKVDWQSLEERGINVQFQSVSSIDEFDFTTLSNDVIVDLVSGSKEQGALLIRECQGVCTSASFVVGQLNGTSVNIDSGEIIQPQYRLSLNERVWLSEGYVIWAARSGNKEIGEIVKDWPNTLVGKTKKQVPKKHGGLKDSLQLKGENRKGGYWLEYFSADVISTWPIVIESNVSVGIIQPNFTEFCAVAKTTMGFKDKDPEQDFSFSSLGLDSKISHKEFSKWLISNQLEEEQKEIIWRNAHIFDIDFIALIENGFVIIGECKDRPINQLKPEFQQRVFSISKKLFPTSSLPLIVHSSKKNPSAGVLMSNWTDLSDYEKVLTSIKSSLDMFVGKNNAEKGPSRKKICSVCKVKKPLNAWTKKSFNDEASTICNKCLRKGTTASDRKEMMKIIEDLVKRVEVLEAIQLSSLEEE